MTDETLIERMIRQINDCGQNSNCYQKVGEDREGYLVTYCTYFSLINPWEPVICRNLGPKAEIIKKVGEYKTGLEYLTCTAGISDELLIERIFEDDD